MIRDRENSLVKHTSVKLLRSGYGRSGTIQVYDRDFKILDTATAPSGLMFDRFVRDQWRNKPEEGEVTFVNAFAPNQMTVRVCKNGLSNPHEYWVLTYDPIVNRT